MTAYRHLTNLRTPIDNVDGRFLATLSDYRSGPPLPATPEQADPLQPTPVAELQRNGIVGIYTTQAAVDKPAVKRLTKWNGIQLGQELVEADGSSD